MASRTVYSFLFFQLFLSGIGPSCLHSPCLSFGFLSFICLSLLAQSSALVVPLLFRLFRFSSFLPRMFAIRLRRVHSSHERPLDLLEIT